MTRHIALFLLIAGVATASTNEITVSTTVKVNKDAVQITRQSGSLLVQMAGKRYNTQTISLTTTNQFLTKGSVQSAGWCYMRNLETNATAQANISFDGGATTTMVFKAKEPALFRLNPDALVSNFTGAASSGSVDFEITVIED